MSLVLDALQRDGAAWGRAAASSKVMPTGFGARRKPPAGRAIADLTAHDEVSYLREGDHLVLARVLLAQSQPDQALGLLELMDALADSRGRTGA